MVVIQFSVRDSLQLPELSSLISENVAFLVKFLFSRWFDLIMKSDSLATFH
jgi:hypothetical protein